MNADPRDSLWDAVFEVYYDSYYEEMAASWLVSRWTLVDTTTNIIVALTASGSAVAGWALWNTPNFRPLWTVLAATAAVVSLLHAVMQVKTYLKETVSIETVFQVLRIELDTLRQRMNIDPQFDIEEFKREYLEFRKRFTDAVARRKHDPLLTDKRARKIQDRLDEKLGNDTEEGEDGNGS